MLNLKVNILASILLLVTFQSLSQKQNKYTRANAKVEAIQYSVNHCYSRSILVIDSVVYTANSDGGLYTYNLKNDEVKNLMKGRKFQEMRDLAYVNGKLLGMQSGSDGLLAYADTNRFEDYIIQHNNMWIGVFLDGMDFHDSTGFIMGDPVDGYFSLFHTFDGGKTWKPCEGKIKAEKDEAGFAASGTNVQVLNDSTYLFVSGGMTSRFFKSTDNGKTWTPSVIPYFQGEGSGAFSMCFIDENNGVVVGGDYTNPEMNLNNSYYTTDGGEFWTNSKEQVLGYRCCVIEVDGVFYACGRTGIDISTDNGDSWKPFAYGRFFAMTSAYGKLFVTTSEGSFIQFDLIK